MKILGMEIQPTGWRKVGDLVIGPSGYKVALSVMTDEGTLFNVDNRHTMDSNIRDGFMSALDVLQRQMREEFLADIASGKRVAE